MADKVVIDCGTGQVTTASFSAGERAAFESAQREDAARRAMRQTEEDRHKSDLAEVRAWASDGLGTAPVPKAALARLLGAL